MCEVLVDDFSLLNAYLPDADVAILGAGNGFTRGNTEAVHEVVGSLLRNDQIVHTTGGTAREQTIPIKISGPHSAARASMAAKVHLALLNPQKVTIVPCDGWGAPAWWRIQYAEMAYVEDDVDAKLNGYILYNITLGVDAWAKATETYTATGSNAVAPTVIYDHATTGATGWFAENGTLDAGSTYVGVLSDGSSATKDTLKHASIVWDATTFDTITVECKVNPAAGGGFDTSGGSVTPDVTVYGLSGTWQVAASTIASRVDLGSGWYAETLTFVGGANRAWVGIGVKANGGNPADQDLKVRKITMASGSAFPSGMGTLFFPIPGSAPTTGDLTVSDTGGGLLVYTAPNLPELIDGTIEGTYAIVADMTGSPGGITDMQWSVSDGVTTVQSGSVHLDSLPYNGRTGWVTLGFCYLPPAPGAAMSVTVTGVGGTFSGQVLTLWVSNPLTGYTADLTIVQGASDALTIVAPTPARPVFSYLFDGVQVNSRIRAKGDHVLDPGTARILLAWSGGSAPGTVTATWEGYPAFHTEVPPKHRWFS